MSGAASAPLDVPARRRPVFRAQRDRLLPGERRCYLIRPPYGTDTARPGRTRVARERMVRPYLQSPWYHLWMEAGDWRLHANVSAVP